MEALSPLQTRLSSLDDLRTIVKTMKALSAASIRQYERATASLSEYDRTVTRGLYVVLRDGPLPTVARPPRGPRRVAGVVFGSDHGLCGRFNETLADHAAARLRTLCPEPARRRVLAVGGRAAASLGLAGEAVEGTLVVPASAPGIGGAVEEIVLILERWIGQGVAEVHLFYNRRARGRAHAATEVALWPLDLARLREPPDGRWPSRSLPTFTMDRDALLGRLLRQHLFARVFRACAESLASEHASRLAAMQSAERNLDERMEEVAALVRRARQTKITAELLDVVSGFEAAGGEDG